MPADQPAIVTALTDRVLLLEEILRRLTYRDGDGNVRVGYSNYPRVETVVPRHMHRVLDSIHPPLEPDDD